MKAYQLMVRHPARVDSILYSRSVTGSSGPMSSWLNILKQIILCLCHLSVQNIFWPAKFYFWSSKLFWPSNIFWPSKFFLAVQNFFGHPKLCFGCPNFFWSSKFFWTVKIFWATKNILDGQKIF